MHYWPASSAAWLQFVSVSFTVGRGIGHRCAIVSVASLLTCMYIGSTQGDTPHKTRACCITEKPARKTLATALDRWKDPTRSSMTPLTPSHPPCVVSPHAHQSGTSHCPNFCLTHRGSWQQQRNTHNEQQRTQGVPNLQHDLCATRFGMHIHLFESATRAVSYLLRPLIIFENGGPAALQATARAPACACCVLCCDGHPWTWHRRHPLGFPLQQFSSCQLTYELFWDWRRSQRCGDSRSFDHCVWDLYHAEALTHG